MLARAIVTPGSMNVLLLSFLTSIKNKFWMFLLQIDFLCEIMKTGLNQRGASKLKTQTNFSRGDFPR